MKPLFSFSQKRFTERPIAAQHKKCAELLRTIFEKKNTNLETYAQWCLWMQIPYLSDTSTESLLDRYHDHLNKAGISVREHNLPQIRKGDKTVSATPLPLTIYLDNIRSAHNVGSIVRTTEALALGEIALSPSTPRLDQKKVMDTAMHTEKWVTWSVVSDIQELQRPIIALETCENATSLNAAQFPPRFTLAVGNEEYGCSKEILDQAETIISIPLYGRKNSLNVANAFAIAAATLSEKLR